MLGHIREGLNLRDIAVAGDSAEDQISKTPDPSEVCHKMDRVDLNSVSGLLFEEYGKLRQPPRFKK
jgi:hypothetical protein